MPSLLGCATLAKELATVQLTVLCGPVAASRAAGVVTCHRAVLAVLCLCPRRATVCLLRRLGPSLCLDLRLLPLGVCRRPLLPVRVVSRTRGWLVAMLCPTAVLLVRVAPRWADHSWMTLSLVWCVLSSPRLACVTPWSRLLFINNLAALTVNLLVLVCLPWCLVPPLCATMVFVLLCVLRAAVPRQRRPQQQQRLC